MNIQKHIKEIVITLSVISITAGAYAALSNVNTGDNLTATLWNSMVTDVNSCTDKLNGIYNAGGSLGIGTSSPNGKLGVYSSSTNPLDSLAFFQGLNGRYLGYYQNLNQGSYATNVSTGDQALVFNNDSSASTYTNGMYIGPWTNTSGGLKLMENGNVGVGVSSPLGLFDVGGLTMFGSTTKQMATSVIGGLLTSYSWDKTTSNHVDWEIRAQSGPQLYLKTNGNVGIGHSNPSQLLHVNGTALSAAWNTSSDIRKKEDIKPIVNPLEKIEKLRGVTFKWKESKKEDTGVIAQEVEKEFPEFVTTGTDGYKSVDYGKLVAPLIESVKELKKENDDLRKRIEALENK